MTNTANKPGSMYTYRLATRGSTSESTSRTHEGRRHRSPLNVTWPWGGKYFVGVRARKPEPRIHVSEKQSLSIKSLHLILSPYPHHLISLRSSARCPQR